MKALAGSSVLAGGRLWTIQEVQSATSTNLLAASLPAWSAIRADRQTAGRGRFQRHWVSDAGGLWLSAVVPMPSRASAAPLLPLGAGWAVCEALRELGVSGLHLRWPNDVLHERRKLAGLLIDRFVPRLAVIGVGLNVSNRPESFDPALDGQVCRLADFVSPAPALSSVMERVLCALGRACALLEAPETESVLGLINALWPRPLRVEVDLDGQLLPGHFAGVDAAGRLELRTDQGETKFLEPHQVRLLREINHS